MDRTYVTAGIVANVEKLLSQGEEHPVVAAEVGITPYIVGLIALNAGRAPANIKPPKSNRRIRTVQAGVDAVTVRRIQRMLRARWLNHREIAREAGVSTNFVAGVASGRRQAVTLGSPILNEGERFLPKPTRCTACAALISVVPCRGCQARRNRTVGPVCGTN